MTYKCIESTAAHTICFAVANEIVGGVQTIVFRITARDNDTLICALRSKMTRS